MQLQPLLMHQITDEDIYIFGFSRGSYIARFLAEMLDYVGLLEAGNEEMVRCKLVPSIITYT